MEDAFVCTECKSSFTLLTVYRLEAYHCPVCLGEMYQIAQPITVEEQQNEDDFVRKHTRREHKPRKLNKPKGAK